tara:strand:+ start:766 stop:1152 length:387 start_codon:yes stop_codon:yes gene_type:complete
MFPESLKFDLPFWGSDKESTVVESVIDGQPTRETVANFEAESNKQIVPELDPDQLARVEVGQTKKQILAILGPSADVDTGETLADHYVKDGEVYDVLYFRTKLNGVEDIRAFLFEADQLIGIGWTKLN